VKYAGAYFGCKVNIHKKIKAAEVMESSRTGDEGQLQLDAETVRNKLMKMKKPRDSFCMLGVTMCDLYIIKHGEAWNFVFGQASLMDGVGVFSFARYDPSGCFLEAHDEDVLPEMEPKEYQLLLRRCCRVLTHEGTHVIGLRHCIDFQCLMNGSNHLGESDGSPLHLCPLCLRKLQNGCSFDPIVRYNLLLEWYLQHDFIEDAEWVRAQLELVEAAIANDKGGAAVGRDGASNSTRACPMRRCQGKKGCICPEKTRSYVGMNVARQLQYTFVLHARPCSSAS